MKNVGKKSLKTKIQRTTAFSLLAPVNCHLQLLVKALFFQIDQVHFCFIEAPHHVIYIPHLVRLL